MKRNKRNKKIFISFVSVLMILCITPQALAYDQGAAQRYSDQYVLSPNLAYRYWDGGDCTNFVSQCMKAGGMAESDDWYYNNYFSQSATWIHANELKEFFKNKLNLVPLSRWSKYGFVNEWGYEYYSYVNDSNRIEGLGSEIIFYDWNADGEMNHAAIVVGTNHPIDDPHGTSVGDLINQHTKNRQWKYWHLDYYNEHRNYTEIYAYRLPDSV